MLFTFIPFILLP